ncbi:hypothetical protein [Mycolicibacterium septicum]|uniref:hypothetical protein n=1 Tax=Mycolicibacterium septicum TaxID=98668 RepID=UPI001AF7D55D|nr:hypothetical protein [Mycolicibacterium septicum]QRY53385.1 hypothetical protein JVX95_08730 [Mycolicibacterium septicum]
MSERGQLPRRPGDAVWAEFFRCLAWNSTFSHKKKIFAIHGDQPAVARCTLSLTGGQLQTCIPELEKDVSAWAGGWTGDLILFGANPFPGVRRYFTDDPAAGLVGVRDGDTWRWSAACWALCDACDRLLVYNDLGETVGRPCGHTEFPVHNRGQSVPLIGRIWTSASYSVAERRSRHRQEVTA